MLKSFYQMKLKNKMKEWCFAILQIIYFHLSTRITNVAVDKVTTSLRCKENTKIQQHNFLH